MAPRLLQSTDDLAATAQVPAAISIILAGVAISLSAGAAIARSELLFVPESGSTIVVGML